MMLTGRVRLTVLVVLAMAFAMLAWSLWPARSHLEGAELVRLVIALIGFLAVVLGAAFSKRSSDSNGGNRG